MAFRLQSRSDFLNFSISVIKPQFKSKPPGIIITAGHIFKVTAICRKQKRYIKLNNRQIILFRYTVFVILPYKFFQCHGH